MPFLFRASASQSTWKLNAFMDRISPERRSALMSRIRSKDTKPELIVRRMLHRMGYRYILHDRHLPGRPDLVFPRRKKVVFVHGCFWHGHTCGRGFRPKTNASFWSDKIEANKLRDLRSVRELTATGWSVLSIWECMISAENSNALRRKLVDFLDNA